MYISRQFLRQIGLAIAMLIAIPQGVRAGHPAAPPDTDTAVFVSFHYTGSDPLAAAVTPDTFLNPILAGFHPDPSICRVGDDYYLVNSSFCYYPGIPVFHSRDLVHWRQIGSALTRPSQTEPLDGTSTTGGVYAATIRHHGGKFYIASTLAGRDGGNFVVTADNPAGPWSDPIWFRDINGIDPSPFFDDDGRAYLVHNGPPPDDKPLYDGHRALWLQQVDLERGKTVGDRRLLINGGTDLAKKPIWIEGPHLLKKDGWYVLIAAEGGTGPWHSEVAFRSRALTGPYEPFPGNPILTQRTLPATRPNPVTCTGHADLVELPNGQWWAVFLGCRPAADGYVLMGRETFLLPAAWRDGWPVILENGSPIPLVVKRPPLAPASDLTPPAGDAFTFSDEFNARDLDPGWFTFRRPKTPWWTVGGGALHIHPLSVRLTSPTESPAFLARRQQHADYECSTAVDLATSAPCDAGLAVFQDERHHFFLGVRKRAGAPPELFIERTFVADRNSRAEAEPETLVKVNLPADARRVELKVTGNGLTLGFAYRLDPARGWSTALSGVDASILTEKVAGGFTGVCLGLHARVSP